MKITTWLLGKILFGLVIGLGVSILVQPSLGSDWRSDENVHRILSGRSDHTILTGLLPNDKRLEFAELCILHLRRHVEGDQLLTEHQLTNLLGWINRATFNDAAIYLDALLAEDISDERRSQVMTAIARSMHEPTRVSSYTAIETARSSLANGELETEEAKLSVAFALATKGDGVGAEYVERILNDLTVSDDLRSRAALFAVREKLPIAIAFEYCERMLSRDDAAIGRKTAAAIALMENGVPAAIEWTEHALHNLSVNEHHRIRLLAGLVKNGQMHRLAELVSILGSTSSLNVAQTRIALDALIDFNAGLLGDVRHLLDTQLQASLVELIEAHGDRLKWDARAERLVVGE